MRAVRSHRRGVPSRRVALGGVPAVTMAYLAEQVHPDGLGLAMSLYVDGTAIGGMAGRVISGVVADLFSWRMAIGTIDLLNLLSMLAFRALPPPCQRVTRNPTRIGQGPKVRPA
ncbi:Uncharacterized MFS-type transporter YybF (fragment) [Paraburkholderia ribeironis]|uniref:Uncharacterized MFS-type transporter YybF n=1 Tax=Paraburkholderia ribeironis TaxID=1247936 RepID=A0A1N7RJF8_9BURK